MELIFIEENHGIGKNSGKPYHLVKLADPQTYQNHTISVDPSFMQPGLNIKSGQLVKVEGRLATPYQNTQFLCTSIKPVQKAV